MSALGVSQFASVPLEPRIPLSLQVAGKGVKVQDVVLSREAKEVVPIGKSTGLNPLEQVDIRVSSQNGFLIPSSMVLEFDLFNLSTDAGGSTTSLSCGWDDMPGVAVFDRLDLFVASQLVERIEDLASTTTARVYAEASKDYYEYNLKNLVEAWKFNTAQSGNANISTTDMPTLSGGDATGITTATLKNWIDAETLATRATYEYTPGTIARQQLATAQKAQGAVSYVAGSTAGVPAIGAGRHYGGVSKDVPIRCQVPLALVCGFCNNLEAFPLSFVSDVRFQFTLNLANKCMYSPTATDIPNYRVDNVRMRYDEIQVSTDYIKAMTSILSSGDESMGFHLPIHTLTTRKVNIGSPGAGSKVDSVFTIATPFLDSVLTWARPSQVAVNQYNTSAMPCWFTDFGSAGSRTTAGIQLQIGGQRYPFTAPIDNAVELYASNTKEKGELVDVKGTSSVNSFASLIEKATTGGICYYYQNFHSLVGLESQAEGLEMESVDTNSYAGQIQFSSTYDNGVLAPGEQVMVGQHIKMFSLVGGVAKVMG